MRHGFWVLLVFAFVGCQKPSAAPQSTADAESSHQLPAEIAGLLERGEYAAALQQVEASLKVQPNSALLYSVRSSIHHAQGSSEQALTDLTRAIELNSQDPRYFNNRGFILLGLQRFPAAQADFDRATELSPDYSNPYNNRGLLMIARGQFASAIEQLDRALRLDPNYVDAYNNRGFAYLQAGNVESALADFNRATKLNPKYVNAINNRGLLKAQVGDLDNAVLEFTAAMMLDPQNPKYYEHRSGVYRRIGNIEMALADEERHDWLLRLQEFGLAISRQPKEATLRIQRARHQLKGDRPAAAMEDVEAALALSPRSVDALLLRGRIHQDLGDFAAALRDAEAALAIEPRQDGHSLRGDACFALQEYDKAIQSFAEARRIDPSVAEAYYRKSQILQASGQADEAADTLKQAVALEPGIVDRVR